MTALDRAPVLVLSEHCGSIICNQTSKCLENGCEKVCVKAPSLCDLHNTSSTGDLSTVDGILSQGRADINCQEWIGRTPVMWAASKGYREMVELLVNKGADVSLVDRFGLNILHAACLGGDEEVVKYVLSHNMVDINSRVGCGRTPVMLAADNGHKAVMELLIGKGADLSLVDYRRDNILHLACRGGHVEMVKCIVSQLPVDINSRGWKKRTPVMVAGIAGHKQVVELLVEKDASLSLKDSAGNNILHLACYLGHTEVVKYIISLQTVDINSRGWKKKTAVMVAGERGHKQVVELLVNNGAKLSVRDRNGNTILHLVCHYGHVDVGKYVLSRHVLDINIAGWKKRTPVMVAGKAGHKQVVELLVKHGANMLLRDRKGNNILHLACYEGRVDVVKYILSGNMVGINSRGKKTRTPVMVAGKAGQKQVVELLVKHGASTSLRDSAGNNILHLACYPGHIEVVKYVLSLHTVDINRREWKKRAPVMIAGEMGHKDVVELLVKHGASPSLQDSDGNNILHLACMKGHIVVVKYVLLLDTVDIDSRGLKGKTPVMMTGERGHKQVVELLVNNGANVLLRDKEGNNILHLVCYEGHIDVMKYILSENMIDINSRGKKTRTPVMVAGKAGHKHVVELLVKHGASPSLRDSAGNNILHFACYPGHIEVVKYVLSLHTVDINGRGWKKRTPMMVAGNAGHKHVVELLVNNGADLSYKDNDANNILHLSCFHGHVEVVKYVLSLNMVDINSRGRQGKTPVMVAETRGHKQLVDLLVACGANV